MAPILGQIGGEGLERSCTEATGCTRAERSAASSSWHLVQRAAYVKHAPRHVCHLPNRGRRQTFDYRGKVREQSPGAGRGAPPRRVPRWSRGSAGGFGYRQVMSTRRAIAAAVTAIRGVERIDIRARSPFRTTRRWPPPSPMRFGHRWSTGARHAGGAPGGRPARARCRRSHGDSAAPARPCRPGPRARRSSIACAPVPSPTSKRSPTEPLRIARQFRLRTGRVRIAMR